MSTINNLMEIAKRSLNVNQEVIGVIGHNLANVNTEGYSRQRAELSATLPLDDLHYGQVGTGVQLDAITRARDTLLDKQIRYETSTLGEWEKKNWALENIQAIFSEPSDYGFNDILSDFWDAWADLANDPESYAARTVVRERAQVLTDYLNNSDYQLKTIESNLNDEYKARVNDINEYAQQIADLNRKIFNAQSLGQNANDFRDQRDLKLDQLSKIISIQYHEENDGSLNVYICGDILVQGSEYQELTTEVTSRDGVVIDQAVWKSDLREVVVNGGELKGIADARDVEAEYVRQRMDDLALEIVDEVNSLHFSGYGLNGSTGINFFDPETAGAGDIALEEQILTSLDAIAAGATEAIGDNSNALEIAALSDALVMSDGNETMGDYYSGTISALGAHKSNAQDFQDEYDAVLNQITTLRQSVQGVVTDEELTELIKFQRAYGAAATLIQTVDEMMETVINMAAG